MERDTIHQMISFTFRQLWPLALLFVGCVLLAPARAEPYVHSPTQVAFPDEIGGMPRGHLVDYEAKQPGGGVMLRYQRQAGLWADVFVYNLGVKSIPTDLQHPIMAQVRGATDRDIVTGVQKRGGGARRGESATLTIDTSKGALPVFFNSYVALMPEGVENTFVWLWPARNHFFKIRVTRRAGDHEPRAVREFYEAVVRLSVE